MHGVAQPPYIQCAHARRAGGLPDQTLERVQGTPKKFIQVVQPGEDSFALAIVVDATGRADEAPRFPVGKEGEVAPQQPHT